MLIFFFIGILVVFSVKVHTKINSVKKYSFKIRDISNYIFQIIVFGTNDLESPFHIVDVFDAEYIEVGCSSNFRKTCFRTKR